MSMPGNKRSISKLVLTTRFWKTLNVKKLERPYSIVMNRDLTGISKQKDGSFVLKFILTTTEEGITRTVSFKFYFIKPTLIIFVTKKYTNINICLNTNR
jgi:hypothetical protein